ncbi:hypothetical protein M080_3918, partial [Bacteroides fragilis str. 3397 T10]
MTFLFVLATSACTFLNSAQAARPPLSSGERKSASSIT